MDDGHGEHPDRIADQAAQAAGIAVRCTGAWGCAQQLLAMRYELDNGLTIVLAPDPSSAVFAYQTWFRVGSRHEEPERTGLAHLFEHLMFKGTERHPPGAFDLEMERRGTQTNAATWVDWTYYTQTLAARGDNLPVVVHFEVDRMTGLVLDAATFASELDVVKNERRMSVDDSIAGSLGERLYSAAFVDHPYRWPTIGVLSHLEAANLADLGRFYNRYYAPNNATVVVVGGIEPVAALSLLARSYGPVASQPIPRPSAIIEPPQTGARTEVIHKPVVAPQVLLGYHVPAQDHADFAPLEMIAEILAAGDSARLYRRLVTHEELCTEVGCYVAPFAEPGLLEISATVRNGVDPQHVISVIHEELDRLAEGIDTAELEKAKNGLELAAFDGLKDVEGRAEALGHYETNFGDFRRAFEAPYLYRNISAHDIGGVAKRYLGIDNRTAVVAVAETAR